MSEFCIYEKIIQKKAGHDCVVYGKFQKIIYYQKLNKKLFKYCNITILKYLKIGNITLYINFSELFNKY